MTIHTKQTTDDKATVHAVAPFGDRCGILLVIMTFIVYAWFYNGANANQTARFDVVFSFVEPGTKDTGSFRINRFIRQNYGGRLFSNTCDWARNEAKGDDFYSNKAPLPSLMGIPAYAVIYWFERAIGVEPSNPHITYLNCYLTNLFVTVMPMALSAALAFALFAYLADGNRLFAFLSCIGLYFGTLAFPFSTQLWGHTTGLAFCVSGIYFAIASKSRWAGIMAGALLGSSVLCDYTCAIGVIAVGVWLFATRRNKVIHYLVGGAPTLLLYVVYHKTCFDSLAPASSFSNPVFIAKNAVGGLFNPASFVTALSGITVSPYRGLFWYVPLLLGGLSIIPFWRRLRRRNVVVLSIATALTYLLLNLFFNGWHGGNSSGPRYQIVALVWYLMIIASCLPLFKFNDRRDKIMAIALACALTTSIANAFVIATITPMASELKTDMSLDEKKLVGNPIPFFYKTFFAGRHQISSHQLFAIRPGEIPFHPYKYKTFMIGRFIGLPGNVQVVPPILILIFGIVIGIRCIRRNDSVPTDKSDERLDAPIRNE